MNPITFVKRRPLMALTLVVASAGAVVFGLYKLRVDLPFVNSTKLYAQLDDLTARLMQAKSPGKESSEGDEEKEHEEGHQIIVTSPVIKDLVLRQKYVCQIHSQKHIEIRALEGGYLENILIKEGQAVKKGDLLFKILPVLYQAKLDAKQAEAQLADLEFLYSKQLSSQKVVSTNEVALKKAKLTHAKAEAELAMAELNFTDVKAPFDGIVDHLYEQLGSLIKEGDILTTLSDNRVMWVYFNVPEANYLEYMEGLKAASEETNQGDDQDDTAKADDDGPDDDDKAKDKDDDDDKDKDDSDGGSPRNRLGRVSERIELVLANGNTFPEVGKIGAIEAQFNNTTGNIHFRADFPNPNGLLRHGQTGTIVLQRTLHNALIIPQRSMFEILAKQYVFVVDDKGVVHQREIVVQEQLEDLFVIKSGLEGNEKIIFEGVRQVRDGDKVETETRDPKEIFGNLKYHAE
jgi:membrane fusion protein (multidrug efflux system)